MDKPTADQQQRRLHARRCNERIAHLVVNKTSVEHDLQTRALQTFLTRQFGRNMAWHGIVIDRLTRHNDSSYGRKVFSIRYNFNFS